MLFVSLIYRIRKTTVCSSFVFRFHLTVHLNLPLQNPKPAKKPVQNNTRCSHICYKLKSRAIIWKKKHFNRYFGKSTFVIAIKPQYIIITIAVCNIKLQTYNCVSNLEIYLLRLSLFTDTGSVLLISLSFLCIKFILLQGLCHYQSKLS